jgi:hypothetical protein
LQKRRKRAEKELVIQVLTSEGGDENSNDNKNNIDNKDSKNDRYNRFVSINDKSEFIRFEDNEFQGFEDNKVMDNKALEDEVMDNKALEDEVIEDSSDSEVQIMSTPIRQSRRLTRPSIRIQPKSTLKKTPDATKRITRAMAKRVATTTLVTQEPAQKRRKTTK